MFNKIKIITYAHTHIYTHTHTHIYIFIHHTHMYIHTNIHIYIYITMINPSNSTQTIVTLHQIKDILAIITATT